jgi:hypothetical protein
VGLTSGEWLVLGIGLGQLSAWVIVLVHELYRRRHY